MQAHVLTLILTEHFVFQLFPDGGRGAFHSCPVACGMHALTTTSRKTLSLDLAHLVLRWRSVRTEVKNDECDKDGWMDGSLSDDGAADLNKTSILLAILL